MLWRNVAFALIMANFGWNVNVKNAQLLDPCLLVKKSMKKKL